MHITRPRGGFFILHRNKQFALTYDAHKNKKFTTSTRHERVFYFSNTKSKTP